jgi:hypothetical protein
VSFAGPQSSKTWVLGSGDQLQSVLARFVLESGKFALLTTTIKFLGAPILLSTAHPRTDLGQTTPHLRSYAPSFLKTPPSPILPIPYQTQIPAPLQTSFREQGLGLSPLPQGKRQRTIYSLYHARSGSDS